MVKKEKVRGKTKKKVLETSNEEKLSKVQHKRNIQFNDEL